MLFTDQVSILIFSLVILAVAIFVTMSKVIVGPIARLKTVERWVLALSLIGVIMVVAMAASELLFHVLF